VPANVNTNGMITSVDRPGLRVVTADASSVQTSSLGLNAMLDGVFSSLAQRNSGSTHSAPLEPLGYFARPEDPEAFAFLDETQSVVRPRAWLNAFGGLSTASIGAGGQANSRLGGLAAGIDIPVGQSDTVGIFAGAAKGRTLAGSTEVGEESGFAGLYGNHQFDDFTLDMALVLGSSRYTRARSILDGTVPGGVATASADYNGFFISPEVGLERQLDVNGQAIAVRGALQYAGLFVDGYTETGSVGALAMDSSSVQQVTAKASVAVPLLVYSDANITTRLTPRLGVDVTTQFGDQIVTGALAGAPISFVGDAGPSVKLSAGAQLEHQVSDRWSLIADVEGSVSSGDFAAGQGSLTFNVKF
jgi:outer membrane autotransporter protein